MGDEPDHQGGKILPILQSFGSLQGLRSQKCAWWVGGVTSNDKSTIQKHPKIPPNKSSIEGHPQPKEDLSQPLPLPASDTAYRSAPSGRGLTVG